MINLTDAEFIIMNILWKYDSIKAGEIAKIIMEEMGWKRTTTYTHIHRLIKKNAILRTEPNFVCKAILKQDEVGNKEIKMLLKKMYNGSFSLLCKNFIKKENLSPKEIEELKNIIAETDKC
jgi:BlaI family transcriptional regulator, penicillinase repressor